MCDVVFNVISACDMTAVNFVANKKVNNVYRNFVIVVKHQTEIPTYQYISVLICYN